MKWLLILPLAGCLDLDFHTNATTIRATAETNDLTVVRICAGPHDLLDCAEAQYSVNFGGETKDTQQFGTFDSTAQFSSAAADAQLTVLGPEATVTMPAPFAVSRSRIDSDAIELTWSPAGTSDSMSWRLSVNCDGVWEDYDDHPLFGDSGAVRITAQNLSCPSRLWLERTRIGSKGGFVDGSEISARQSRFIDL